MRAVCSMLYTHAPCRIPMSMSRKPDAPPVRLTMTTTTQRPNTRVAGFFFRRTNTHARRDRWRCKQPVVMGESGAGGSGGHTQMHAAHSCSTRRARPYAARLRERPGAHMVDAHSRNSSAARRRRCSFWPAGPDFKLPPRRACATCHPVRAQMNFRGRTHTHARDHRAHMCTHTS